MDILENNAHDGGAPGPVEPGDDTWRHPKTLGLAALALAVLCLFGAGSLRGSAYTLLLNDDGFGGDPTQHKNYLVAGTFLSAAFALIPVVLAKVGLSRLVPDDGEWAGHVLRAALLLGALAVLLDVVRALLAIANDDPSAIQILI